MEPFSIHCVTCKSKLTVTKPSLLGQILACPKCGSMVQIPQSKPSETIDNSASSPTSEKHESSESAESLPQPHDQTDTVEDFGYTAASSITHEANDLPTSGVYPPDEESDNETEALPQDSMDQWKDPSADGKRKKLLISFACVSVLILIGVITAFSFSTDDSAETIANSNQDNSQTRNGVAEQEDKAESQTEVQVNMEATVQEEEEEEGGTEDVTAPDSQSLNPETEPNPDSKDPVQEPEEAEEPHPVAPEGLIPESPAGTNTDEVPKDLDSVIDDVAPFLSNAPVDIESAAPVAKLPKTNNDNPRAPAAPVNIEGGLNFTVPQIDVANPIPLNQFLEFLGTLGNIPFTFDFESLELAGLSHAAVVTHTSEEQTIGQVLTSVLEKIQMTHRIEEGHVLILASVHANLDIKTIIHKQTLPDVNTDEQAIETICQILNTLLSSGDTKIASPVADQENADVFHIEVLGNARMQDRVQQLLDRIANSETGTGSYEAIAHSHYQKLFTMDFNDGAPLLQVLIYLNSNSELQFQVNWKNIWQSGWTPKSQVNVATEKEPLQECLEQILTSNGLSYIARINGVLEITTAEHALAANQIGLYDFSDLPVTKRDALVKTLNVLAENDEDDISIRLVESIPDGRLGLSAPAAIHRLVAEKLE